MKRFMCLALILFLVGCPPPLSYNERLDNRLQDATALDPGWVKLTHPNGNDYKIFRCKTPVGWLVFSSSSRTTTYIPDAKHEWLKPALVSEVEVDGK